MNIIDLGAICGVILMAGALNAVVLRRIEALLERIADLLVRPL